MLSFVCTLDVGEFAGGGHTGGWWWWRLHHSVSGMSKRNVAVGRQHLAEMICGAGAFDERCAAQHENCAVLVALVGAIG